MDWVFSSSGSFRLCRDYGPCAAGQGDCDNNSECQSGLTCVQVPGTDVCCPHPIAHIDYCRDCGSCAAGQAIVIIMGSVRAAWSVLKFRGSIPARHRNYADEWCQSIAVLQHRAESEMTLPFITASIYANR